MMDYIPGQIDDSFQKEHFFLITQDLIWINLLKRFSEMNQSEDYWHGTSDISLKKGDVIVVRFFKSSSSEPYAYLERVIYLRFYPNRHGEVIDYKKESVVSHLFIKTNSFLFNDVSKEFERDKKIESILC